MSFLIFYLRLFGTVHHIRIMVWAGIVAVVTFGVIYMITYIVACVPWPSEQDGFLDDRYFSRCFAIGPKLLLAGCYFGVIMDFYILFMPLSQVKGLVLTRKRKVGISLVFLTGSM